MRTWGMLRLVGYPIRPTRLCSSVAIRNRISALCSCRTEPCPENPMSNTELSAAEAVRPLAIVTGASSGIGYELRGCSRKTVIT